MTANELIKKYSISLRPDGQLAVALPKSAKAQTAALTAIRATRPAIVAELQARAEAEKQARAEAGARLAQNVPGLEELRAIRAQWEAYHDACSRAISSGSGRYPAPLTIISTEEAAAKYPVAAAYLQAESYSLARNDRKSGAGRKAMQAIAAGEDYRAAIAEMEDWGKDIDPWQ